MESKEVKIVRQISPKGRVYEYPARPRKLGRKPTAHHPDFRYKTPSYYVPHPRVPYGHHSKTLVGINDFKLKRQALLEATQFRCSQCGRGNCDLDIHHKDGNGYGKTKHPNNELNNLVVLCTMCHQKMHQESKVNGRIILHLRQEGLTFAEIGKRFGISRQRVHQLFKRLCSLGY